jgi:hypothetical protein
MAMTAVPATARSMAPVHSSRPSTPYVARVASPVEPEAIRPVRAAREAGRVCSRSPASAIVRKCLSRNGPMLWTRTSGAAWVSMSSRPRGWPARACWTQVWKEM